MDAIAAIGLALLLLMVMTGVMIKQQRREREMADARAAARAAEGAMLALESGGSLPGGVRVEALSLSASAAPDGRVWVRVTAAARGRSAEVVGLVDAGAATKTGGGR